MESITKNRQTPQVLRQMTVRAYGEERAPAEHDQDWFTEMGHGWFNVVYRIRLRTGEHVVLKIAPPQHVEVMTYEHGAMATELAALELIRTRTSVPVPDVHFVDRSHELCDADYFFMPCIEGDNFGIVRESLSPAERDTYDEALGAATRRLNEMRGDRFGPLHGPGHATWRAAFTRMAEDVLGDGGRRGVDLGVPYATVRAVFETHQDCLDEVTDPRFVEWDLWDSNVMIADGRIVCIIDHERAFYGDPLMEAGFTAGDLPAFGAAEAFARGYGRAPSTDAERLRRRLYTLYLVLVMVIETDYRGHTDTRQYDWARARLAELLPTFDGAGTGAGA